MSEKINFFDFLNAINGKQKTELDISQYNAFMVNRGLSYHRDTVHWANEMNRFPALDTDMQYAFLLNTVKKGKRFAKWEKAVSDDVIQLIIDYYQCSRQRAQEISKLLNNEQTSMISDKMNKGGR